MSSQLPRLGLMGITGVTQMTPAATNVLQRAGRGSMSGGTRKRKRSGSKKKAAGAKRKRKRSGGKTKARLVKGSKAAKAYMAKIRRMRK